MSTEKVEQIKRLLDRIETTAEFSELAPYFNERMRIVRNRETNKVRYKFRYGDKVEFTASRLGRVVKGTVKEIKQVKALVTADDGLTWDVRLVHLRPQASPKA